MTGAEIVLKQGDNYILFKIRHDGYFVEEYFKDSKMAFKHSFQDTMPNFIKEFMNEYGDPQYEIETFYPQGFSTSLPKNYDFKDLYQKGTLGEFTDLLLENLSKDCLLKTIDPDEEGLFCGYQDYCIFLDFDQKLIFGFLNDDDDEVIFDENFKEV